VNCVLRISGLYTSRLLDATCKKVLNLLKKGLLVRGRLRQDQHRHHQPHKLKLHMYLNRFHTRSLKQRIVLLGKKVEAIPKSAWTEKRSDWQLLERKKNAYNMSHYTSQQAAFYTRPFSPPGFPPDNFIGYQPTIIGSSGQHGQPGQTSSGQQVPGQTSSGQQVPGQPAILGQETVLPQAFSTMTFQDHTTGAWNMDTCSQLHLLSLMLFLVSQHMWHQRLGHPRGEVPRRLVFSNFISKEKPPVLRHACQFGKHVRLPFVSSSNVISSCFDIIHSDVWTSPIPSLSDGTLSRYKARLVATKKYAVEVLDKAHMVNCNPSRTPINTESKLGSDGDMVVDPTLYWSPASSLQYLTFTRPDISYAVQQVYLCIHDPRKPHFSVLKRILRHVRGTLNYGLQLFSSSITYLVAYSDADWVGFPTTRRSTFGYCVFLGNNLLSWSSKRQPTLSRSSAEAEYREVDNVVAETCWLRKLLLELHKPLSCATLVYCDNVSAVYLSSNPV
nr:ribonuclease H-like domain-containing protein [Tanacetum cinerariifolium]